MEKKEFSRIINQAYNRINAMLALAGDFAHRRRTLHLHIGLPSPEFALQIKKTLTAETLLLFIFKAGTSVNIEELYAKINTTEQIIFAPLNNDTALHEVLTLAIKALRLEQHQINITMEPGLSEIENALVAKLGKHMNMLLSNNTCTARNTFLHTRSTVNNIPLLLKNGICRVTEKSAIPEVLICGAGPSLRTQLDTIRNFSGKIPIIAAGHAFPCLAEAGIQPDFIVEIDAESHITWQRHSMKPPCPLVTVPFISPLVASRFDNILWFGIPDSPLNTFLKELDITLEPIAVSRSVIITAIDFAIKAGFKKIALTGSDLCLSVDGTAHAKQSVLDDTDHEGLLEIKGNDSQKVITTAGFEGIREVLQVYLKEIKKNIPSVTIFNCTNGGAFIESTQRLSLEEFCKSLKNEKSILKPQTETIPTIKEKLGTLHKKICMHIDLAKSITDTISLLEKEINNTSVNLEFFKKIQTELDALLTLERNSRDSFLLKSLTEQTAMILGQRIGVEGLDYDSVKRHFTLLGDMLKEVKTDLDFTPGHNPFIFNSFKNFAVDFIKRSDPELADLLSGGDTEHGNKFELISNLQYLPNTSRMLPDGRRERLNDFTSMESAAAQEIDVFVQKEGYSQEKAAVIFFAPGNWAHPVEFAKKYPLSELMIIEVWPELLKQMIRCSLFMNYLPANTIITAVTPELKSWKRIAHSAIRQWKKQDRKILFFEHPHTWKFPDVQESLKQFKAL